MENRPVGRKKNVTEGGSGVHRRGEGLGTGPVMEGGSFNQKSSSGAGGPARGPRGRSPLFMIIVIIVLVLGGGGGITSFLGGGTQYTQNQYTDETSSQTQSVNQTGAGTSVSGQNSAAGQNTASSQTQGQATDILGSLLGGYGSYQGATSGSSASWSGEKNIGKLDSTVSERARPKRTVIKGGGLDKFTIMVYMCGADLESRSAMASKDLQEMLAADIGDNINLIIYTGGCKSWQNNVVSSNTNQIYQVKNGRLDVLRSDMGNVPMTKPDTLSGFIRWVKSEYPADRNALILWDHGGGSTGGYGYDEKFATAGSMSLGGINKALKDGGVTFDFVGFDTCLMATVENAFVVSNYADYLVASEETEPGIGWYYTDWLTALGKNTSMETIQIGKNIIDSFTDACARSCPGQKTTLSLIDLSELSETVPKELADFSKTTTEMINNSDFQTVSSARSSTREFASSSRIDQVDLVDFANRMGTPDAQKLSKALLGTIKYNRTSSNMTNAYGLSIYFPYQKASKVDSMVNTYEDIGMDEDYAKCIQSFASMGVAGQVAAGGTGSALPSLFGELTGSGSSSSGQGASSSEMIAQLLTTFLASDFSSISGLNSSNTSFLGKSLDVEKASEYIAGNRLDTSALIWTTNAEGDEVISLTEDQWKLVQDLELNLYYDDGEGYVNLGFDNIYDFDEEGNLKAQTDKTWISIDGQVVSYHVEDVQGSENEYVITGRVPCYINGNRSNLIIVFDKENEDGYVAGACSDYIEGETETISKNLTELSKGDTIEYVCDLYGYDREYKNTYYLGNSITLNKDMKDMVISNTKLGDGKVYMTYRFTDIYGENYWTSALIY